MNNFTMKAAYWLKNQQAAFCSSTNTEQVRATHVYYSMKDVSDCKFQFVGGDGGNSSTFDNLDMLITVTDQESPVMAIIDLLHIVFTRGL